MTKRKILEYGGVAAGVVMIAIGLVSLVLAIDGRNEVRSSLKQEAIVGSPDMTPDAIAKEAKEAGLPASIKLPTTSVANETIDTGAEARVFAQYMRIHALESTGGLTYAQMGRFQSAANPDDPAGTNDEAAAAKDEKGQPVSNGARNIWVTETSLATALNVSFLAENIAMFGIVVGVALLLSGIGFMILALGGALRRQAAETRAVATPVMPVTATK
ncbi:MAG TPA: hypothetical protein VFG61_02485 [Gaiellaceae bacterium]|jgi:hypothetical protein|nr:hypothetical protein [Gaiellaceae bacterium]